MDYYCIYFCINRCAQGEDRAMSGERGRGRGRWGGVEKIFLKATLVSFACTQVVCILLLFTYDIYNHCVCEAPTSLGC